MDAFSESEEDALKKALGQPKYFIDTPGKLEGERYYWFPNQGNSMTDGTDQSIPAGSLVLGRLVTYDSIGEISLYHPMVFIIDYKGEQFCLLKSAHGIDDNKLCLRSYNPGAGYDDLWLPFQYVQYIFMVERVRLPDGGEFVPERKEVIK